MILTMIEGGGAAPHLQEMEMLPGWLYDLLVPIIDAFFEPIVEFAQNIPVWFQQYPPELIGQQIGQQVGTVIAWLKVAGSVLPLNIAVLIILPVLISLILAGMAFIRWLKQVVAQWL